MTAWPLTQMMISPCAPRTPRFRAVGTIRSGFSMHCPRGAPPAMAVTMAQVPASDMPSTTTIAMLFAGSSWTSTAGRARAIERASCRMGLIVVTRGNTGASRPSPCESPWAPGRGEAILADAIRRRPCGQGACGVTVPGSRCKSFVLPVRGWACVPALPRLTSQAPHQRPHPPWSL